MANVTLLKSMTQHLLRSCMLLSLLSAAAVYASDSDGDGVNDSRDQCAHSQAKVTVNKLGCEIYTEITIRPKFEAYSSTLSFDDIENIGAIASKLQSYYKARITVEGHTDWTGKQTENKPLSIERAKAVANVLQEESEIDAALFQVKGYGELRPIADNKTEEGRMENRRIVIRVEQSKDE